MKKVLLMTDFYLPNPSANGLCIKELAGAFIQAGYETSILCFGIDDAEESIIDGARVYRIKAPLFFRLREYCKKDQKYRSAWNFLRFVRKMKMILFMPIYPMCFPAYAMRYKNYAGKILAKENIGNVVAQYVPFEAAYAGYSLKKKGIRTILYVVDTFTQGVNEQKYKIFGFFAGIWEKKFLKKYDKVLYLENFKAYCSDAKFRIYKEKIDFVSVPFLTVEEDKGASEGETHKSGGSYNILYSGSWGGDRDPVPFCEALACLREKHGMNIQLNYYGYSNDTIDALTGRYDFVSNMGYISADKLRSVVSSSDYLLNLGNSTNTVPSKLINYIATGKPIIHLYTSQTDPCIQYVERYENSYLGKMQDIDLYELKGFLESNLNETADLTKIKEDFKTCTPDYTVNICRNEFEENSLEQ